LAFEIAFNMCRWADDDIEARPLEREGSRREPRFGPATGFLWGGGGSPPRPPSDRSRGIASKLAMWD
jgi:hypothetical protein